MTSGGAAQNNPLHHGQTLYAINDTTLIHLPLESNTARYQRVVFSGTGDNPVAASIEPLDLGSLSDIQDARMVLNLASAKQEVVLLRSEVLSIIEHDGSTSLEMPLKVKLAGAKRVMGLVPGPGDQHAVAVLVEQGAGLAVIVADLVSGEASEPIALPAAVSGTVVGAELIGVDFSTMVMIITSKDAQLRIHAVAWNDLVEWKGPRAELVDAQLKTLSLGSISTKPDVLVSVAVTRMQTKSPDRQIAVAWADTDNSCKLSLVGWGADIKQKVAHADGVSILAETAVDLSFAPSDSRMYRLVSADLRQTGTEQLVLGYPAHYGNVVGSVALILFGLSGSETVKPSFEVLSTYVVAHGGQPLASYDLHLGAGVFGEYLGVQVIGGAATFAELSRGQASILCGFVSVHDGRFPSDLTSDRPGALVGCTTLATIGPDDARARFLAFPSDLTGASVILGPPRCETVQACGQFLAIIQAPPYDLAQPNDTSASANKMSVTVEPPSINFSESTEGSSGYSVSSSKSYSLSKDFGANLNTPFLDLSHHVHNSFGSNFENMRDSSRTDSVAFSASATVHDFFVVYSQSYDVWRYPVVQSSRKDPASEMLVIIPHQSKPEITIIPGTVDSYNYRPVSEVGMLLSYVDIKQHMKLDGWSDGNQIFEIINTTVTEQAEGQQTSYNETNMNGESSGKHFTLDNSISSSAHATLLFSEIPITFGLNLSQSEHFGDQSARTTHASVSKHMSLTITSGHVKDEIYNYMITPYVYQHASLGCLMVAWDATLLGENWKIGNELEPKNRRFNDVDIRLIRTKPFSNDAYARSFSRSIGFIPRQDSTTDIVVEVFNNSIVHCGKVTCELFIGKPKLKNEEGGAKLLPPDDVVAIVQTLTVLQCYQRDEMIFSGISLPGPCDVTVRVSGEGSPVRKIYWNRYTPKVVR